MIKSVAGAVILLIVYDQIVPDTAFGPIEREEREREREREGGREAESTMIIITHILKV